MRNETRNHITHFVEDSVWFYCFYFTLCVYFPSPPLPSTPFLCFLRACSTVSWCTENSWELFELFVNLGLYETPNTKFNTNPLNSFGDEIHRDSKTTFPSAYTRNCHSRGWTTTPLHSVTSFLGSRLWCADWENSFLLILGNYRCLLRESYEI